ncbi:hypothetical protein [Marinomonas colpomeniae]|uniref:Lipoprotein n=1 Tax=Marinomonas colpomeniae TaxID=2774408 RepID=A0ABR8P243_9GAMM|nr:hypothetical protein [Marinomonas colpomeniae]MBD5771864.1 hypothetical protein [Marinomonas colpomeniae]
MKLLVVVLILLVQGCSNMEEVTCPPVTKFNSLESEELNQTVLNNDFMSGCVTELVSDLEALQSTESQNQCQNDFDETLSYDQWMTIYNSCMIK